MSHHITLRNLIADFKAKTESGIVQSDRLSMLTAVSMACALPLPNNGANGSGEAYLHVSHGVVPDFLSDINECLYFSMNRVSDLIKAIYINRYEAVYNPVMMLEAPSIKQIIATVFDGDADATNTDSQQTMALWGGSFMTMAQLYVKEYRQEKAVTTQADVVHNEV